MPRRLWGTILIALAFTTFVLADVGRAQAPGAQKKDVGRKTVKLKVLLEEEDDELTIDGKPTTQTGKVRNFESPALEPGKKYTYTVVAVIRPNNYTTITRTRKVPVEADKDIEVDMRKKDPRFPDSIVIRYVPTEEHVVDAMCKLANVGKNDVVFDLGCGDGRIVITAVSKYGAKRGVGVDIDPERITEAKANAKDAKVEGKVEFRKEDVLKLKDLSEATVVTLYMGDELNLALRPILWKLLKPGTRVVSHRFTMGDWKPDKVVPIRYTDGEEYNLYLWTIKPKDKEKTKDKPRENKDSEKKGDK